MNPYLQPALLSPPPPLEITEAEFLSLKRSRPILNSAFSLEENYDLLIGNYLELENSALSLTATSMARQLYDYHEVFELRAEMNRRAVNFLSSARLYVDQLLQRVGDGGGNKEDIKSCLSAQYDNFFEYRFMEALRNHVQHSGSAVHSSYIVASWIPPGELSRQEFVLKVFTRKCFLALDSTFKKTVLKECPEEVDTLGATRRYLESLSVVHEFARCSIEKSVAEARSSFEDAIKKYTAFTGESPIGLTAYATPDRDPSHEGFPIFLDWDDVRIKLSLRNRSLLNLSKRVILSVPT